MFVCNGVTQSASGDVFSGYVSSDPPNNIITSGRTVCVVQVRNLPPNATLKFDVVDLQIQNQGDAEYYLRIGCYLQALEEGDVILRKSQSPGQIILQTTRTGFADDADKIRFNIRYTGKLICDTPGLCAKLGFKHPFHKQN